MIDHLRQLLITKDGVLPVSIWSVGGERWEPVNLIAVDSVGIAYVDKSNKTKAAPWSQVELLDLGDLSG